MCGISVVIGGSMLQCEKMDRSIAHRGTETIKVSLPGDIHICYRWLKITDATATEAIFEHNGTYAFLNGYISNYRELTKKYDITLRTNCDTEAVVKLLDKVDEDVIKEFTGVFALVWWDKKAQKLSFSTDPYGGKQLYTVNYFYPNLICSENKGIKAVLDQKIFDSTAIDNWKYSLGTEQSPHTIFGTKKIQNEPDLTAKQSFLTYDEAVMELRRLLQQSFDRNFYPLAGVFLSGGIDSGIIAQYLKPDYAFSMDYVDENYSEIHRIKQQYGIANHYTMICNKAMADKYAPLAAKILDDPRAGSCYTNYALSELASKFCRVLYSGAGADELFDGYTHRNGKTVSELVKRTAKNVPTKDYEHLTRTAYDFFYLRGILTVEDRMASNFTMETRYPFLDQDVVRFALSLPMEYKKNKRILKDAMPINSAIMDAPKKGWSNPYFTNDEWVDMVLKQHIR